MQTKRNIRSKATDVLFVLICLSGAVFSLWQFQNKLYQGLEKLNEQPIASITFKYRTAQRCFLDRVLWDRLRQNSPVYNGDSIRTASQSEAVVTFIDGTTLSLDENTLVQIFFNNDSITGTGASVSFDSGNISVQSSAFGVAVNSGNNTFRLVGDSGASVSAASGSDVVMQVDSGSAVLESGGQSLGMSAGSAVIAGAGGITEVPFIVTQPAKNIRYITESPDPYQVPFVCRVAGGTNVPLVILAVAGDSSFGDARYYAFNNIDDVAVSLAAGDWWWQIYLPEENLASVLTVPAAGSPEISFETAQPLISAGNGPAASGKLSVLYAEPPQVITPVSDAVVSYRSKNPPIRFVWTGSESASSFLFEIADNPQMNRPVLSQRSAQMSSIVSNLGTGTWYYRITPYYSINNYGYGTPTPVRQFSIVQNAALEAPVLQVPVDGNLVNVGSRQEGESPADLYFSWKSTPENVNYTFSLWRTDRKQDSLISVETTNNYVSLQPDVQGITTGQWSWQVSITDTEGNSEISPVRSFYAVEQDIEQRTVFPPNNYRLASMRTQDIKYVWKTNIIEKTHLQVSTTPDFSTLVIDAVSDTTSLAGRFLDVGTYYWRVSATLGDIEIATEPKTLIIEPPLDIPVVQEPVAGGKAVVRSQVEYEFSWQPVQEADYYQFKLFRPDGTPLYEENYIEHTSLSLDLEDVPEGYYTWTLQAHREETMEASKSSGYTGSYSFLLRQLRPVSLETPADGSYFDGISAIKDPASAQWYTKDDLSYARFQLWQETASGTKLIQEIENPERIVQFPRLYEGEYFWTVDALTFDDLDISAQIPNRFTVGAIAKLPATAGGSPEDDYVIDVEYLLQSRSILFRWEPVADAEQYIFRITRQNDTGNITDIVSVVLDAGTTEYELTDLSVLDRGRFEWSVEAQNLFEGEIFQRGVPHSAAFIIDIPEITVPEVKEETGDRYAL